MRTILYAIFDMSTGKRIYTSVDLYKVNARLADLDANKYEIRHTWRSF